jgi:hypothetical protein
VFCSMNSICGFLNTFRLRYQHRYLKDHPRIDLIFIEQRDVVIEFKYCTSFSELWSFPKLTKNCDFLGNEVFFRGIGWVCLFVGTSLMIPIKKITVRTNSKKRSLREHNISRGKRVKHRPIKALRSEARCTQRVEDRILV